MEFFNRNAGVIALIALVIAVGGYFYPQIQAGFGQITDTFTGDIYDASTSFKLNGSTFYSSSGLTTGTSATISVPSSNTATSSLAVGCVQLVATSTATPIRLLFTGASATTTISGTAFGAVAYGFGTCPF